MQTEHRRTWSARKSDPELAEKIVRELGVSPFLARLLVNRGVDSVDAAAEFLTPSLDHLHDPFLLPDIAPAVARVKQALQRKEKIMVHGDYDVDGITSASLLIRVLRALDADVLPRVPHRGREGYDIKPLTVQEAKAEGVSLIITADCGVTACETVSHAVDLGIDIVVTDHHEPGPELPNAVAVVNPRRHDSAYPFKELAGVGVAFKFAEALVRDLGYSVSGFQRRFLDLVALGTVGDVAPLLGENRTLVKFGLEEMASTRKVGLKTLIHNCGLAGKALTTHNLGYILAPRINAVGRLDDSAIALQLFLTKDDAEAGDLVGVLDQRNIERQAEQARIWSEVTGILDEREMDGLNVVVLAAPGWNAGVVGIVASKVVENYGRPAVLISADEEKGIGSGSARSIEAFDIGGALNQCRDLLLRCGGHTLAAGLSVELDKLERFEEKLNSIAGELIKPEDLIPCFAADSELRISDVSRDIIEDLKQLEPYGAGNPEPLFITRQANVVETRLVGSDKAHLKLRVATHGAAPTDCIAFGFGGVYEAVQVGSQVDLCYNIRLNQFNGTETVQLVIKDLNAGNNVYD